MADWQPEHTRLLAVVHSPAACNILHPGGTSHESKWGVSWLKQCRGHFWWKTSEQEFKGAVWQECNGVTGAKGVEHDTCIYSWKTVQREVKGITCFAYNLRKKDSLKENWRNQKSVVQKRWQWQCAFCWTSSYHLLRSCGPRVAALQLWSHVTPCVLAQRPHHVCNCELHEKSRYCRKGNCYSNICIFLKTGEADRGV